MTLLASAGFAQEQERNSLDANLRWALFQQYEAICKSFHIIASHKADQDAETLLRDLKASPPNMESSCVGAHRRAAEEATIADLHTHFYPFYQRWERICYSTKRSGGDEGCEIESRRTAGEVFVRQAITKAVCASTLRVRVGTGLGSGLCISLPGIDGQEERWAPFISAVFFGPSIKQDETAGCFSPGQQPSSDRVPQALATLFAGDRTVASVTERMTRAGFSCGRKDCSRRNLTLYTYFPAKERTVPSMAVLDAAPFVEISSSPAGEVTKLCLKPQCLIAP